MFLRISTAAGLFVVTVVAAAGAVGVATSASISLVKIHQAGTNSNSSSTGIRGRFTIELAGATFGPGGTTLVYPDPGATKLVNGEEQLAFSGRDTLTSKKGRLVLGFSGTHIDLNTELASNGQVVGPAVEYGTWRIRAASGIYRGWKGGGNWASVTYGYGNVQPYSVEWDGYVNR